MVIIVEGIDRVGKTTLCNMLNKSLGYPIFKEDVRDFKDTIQQYANFCSMLSIVNMCKCLNANIIFDRFFATEYVYGRIERGYSLQLADLVNESVVQLLNDIQCIFVYVRPTDISASSKEHGKNLEEHDKLFFELFNSELMKDSKMLKIDCDFNSLSSVVEIIKGMVDC
ncbi:MAG: deoxynucleoside kinase [Clostridia bacterium]|nr:deoxynucleoside kinase [Clostridia bacterium]